MRKGSCGRPAGGRRAPGVRCGRAEPRAGRAAGAGLGKPCGRRTEGGARGGTGDVTPERRAGPAPGEPSTPSHPRNLLEQGFKRATMPSGLWLFEKDTGCSLANTGLRSASLDLPYLGNQSGKGKKSEAIFIIEAGKASASTRISAADVAKRFQAQNIPAWGTECAH